jgi:hypothetical protein
VGESSFLAILTEPSRIRRIVYTILKALRQTVLMVPLSTLWAYRTEFAGEKTVFLVIFTYFRE